MNVLSLGMYLSPKIQLFPLTCRMEVLGHQAKFLLANLTILKVKQVRIQQLISQRPKKKENKEKLEKRSFDENRSIGFERDCQGSS